MSLCFNLNGTILTLSDETLKSETSIDFWKEVFKEQSNPQHYRRFLRILANKRRLRVLPGRLEQKLDSSGEPQDVDC